MSHTFTPRPTTPTPPMTEPMKNLAETLADVLPEAKLLDVNLEADKVFQAAVPKGHELKMLDFEHLLPTPRRNKLAATTSDAESFLEYVKRHHLPDSTVLWCNFNPQTFALDFTAVFDDAGAGNKPGWRSHVAKYQPELSAEWKVWSFNNGPGQAKGQLDFASFLERQESDIAAVEGMPTSLQMMTMATAFEANSEKRVKSVVKLQGGGVRLDFVDDNDSATEEHMRLFEKFAIGVPVFWAGPGYRVDARLKYRQASSKVTFWYELIRPDRVHEAAALDVIKRVRAGLPEGLPLIMGNASHNKG